MLRNRYDGNTVRRWYSSLAIVVATASSLSLNTPTTSSSDDPKHLNSCASSVICPKEELTYEVTYMNIHLGQVRVRTFGSTMAADGIHHRAVVYADSYEGLPLVDLHAITHTVMDKDFFSLGSRSLEKKDDKWELLKTTNDLSHHRVIVEKGWQNDLRTDSPVESQMFDTLQVPDPSVLDGLSILYFARANVNHQWGTMRMPAVVNGKLGAAVFNFGNNTRTLHSDALGGDIRTVELSGKAEFEGMFGLTGDFKGWFTDDTAAIPVKGELQVIIGHVTVELISYKRDGWNPPLAENK